MHVVIAGGAGFLGRRLAAALSREHTITVLSRNAAAAVPPGVSVAAWQPDRELPPAVLDTADAVVNLAGEPVAQRWTDAARRRIRESRVVSTRHLVSGIARSGGRGRLLLSASAVGLYGSRGDEPLTEVSRPGIGFLSEVCAAWEYEAMVAANWGARVVTLRIGVVLSTAGGALPRMLPVFRAGAGGRLGSGRQWMSWIHIDDLVELVRFALAGHLEGPVNATAPEPVRNQEFTRLLAGTLRRPAVLPVPETVLRLLFGEMSQVLLASQRVLPQAALGAGFRFRYPDLGGAFDNLLRRP